NKMITTPFTHRNLPGLLLQAREAVMGHFRPGLRGQGLTDQQWRVLRCLSAQGDMDTGSIAAATQLLGPSLTGVLTRMERGGLISRWRDAADARRTVVQATAQGLARVGELSSAIETHYAAIEATLGKDRLVQLYALLDALIAMEQSMPAEATA
ncbi:MAG: homoprotocatechuate degradation operon regulator HpaR, partial [Pseudomonadota bacterium]